MITLTFNNEKNCWRFLIYLQNLIHEGLKTIRWYFYYEPSPEKWPTKAKEATSPLEVRLTLLDNNPVFQCFN